MSKSKGQAGVVFSGSVRGLKPIVRDRFPFFSACSKGYSTQKCRKGQAGVAAGILVVVILAVGILYFSGESDLSGQLLRKSSPAANLQSDSQAPDSSSDKTSAISGFGGAADPGSAHSCTGNLHEKSEECKATKIGKDKKGKAILCGDNCAKLTYNYEVIAPAQKVTKYCYLCKKQACDGSYYTKEECQKDWPISEGYLCEKFYPSFTTAGSTATLSATFCYDKKKECPPPITAGFDKVFVGKDKKMCDEEAKKNNGKCVIVPAKVPCWGLMSPKGCDKYNEPSTKWFDKKARCESECKELNGNYVENPATVCRDTKSSTHLVVEKGKATLEIETCYGCRIVKK